MKKRGFTLAEVLITMGIIGVIAALILPALVKQSQNKAIMASLSSIVTNLESAFTRAVEEEHVDELGETQMWENTADHAVFIGNLKKYFPKIAGFRDIDAVDYYDDKDTELHYMNATGGEDRDSAYESEENEWTVDLSGGSALFVVFRDNEPLSETEAFTRGTVIRNVLADIIIDANGASRPNVIGRDVFKFYLASDGKIYPHGSREYSRFVGGNENNAWTGNAAGFACHDNIMAETWGCSARVVEEGYNINY